jgi:hypothetical protein
MGKRNLEYRKHGKIVVALPSIYQYSGDSKKVKAIYCYAYSMLYSFICADWFDLYDKDKALGIELYGLDLGRPLEEKPSIKNGVAVRTFERGIVALNTLDQVVKAKLTFPESVTSVHEVGGTDTNITAVHMLSRDLQASTAVIFTYTKWK